MGTQPQMAATGACPLHPVIDAVHGNPPRSPWEEGRCKAPRLQATMLMLSRRSINSTINSTGFRKAEVPRAPRPGAPGHRTHQSRCRRWPPRSGCCVPSRQTCTVPSASARSSPRQPLGWRAPSTHCTAGCWQQSLVSSSNRSHTDSLLARCLIGQPSHLNTHRTPTHFFRSLKYSMGLTW